MDGRTPRWKPHVGMCLNIDPGVSSIQTVFLENFYTKSVGLASTLGVGFRVNAPLQVFIIHKLLNFLYVPICIFANFKSVTETTNFIK